MNLDTAGITSVRDQQKTAQLQSDLSVQAKSLIKEIFSIQDTVSDEEAVAIAHQAGCTATDVILYLKILRNNAERKLEEAMISTTGFHQPTEKVTTKKVPISSNQAEQKANALVLESKANIQQVLNSLATICEPSTGGIKDNPIACSTLGNILIIQANKLKYGQNASFGGIMKALVLGLSTPVDSKAAEMLRNSTVFPMALEIIMTASVMKKQFSLTRTSMSVIAHFGGLQSSLSDSAKILIKDLAQNATQVNLTLSNQKEKESILSVAPESAIKMHSGIRVAAQRIVAQWTAADKGDGAGVVVDLTAVH